MYQTDIVINSISELLLQLQSSPFDDKIVWYRGQRVHSWKLESHLSRLPKGIDNELMVIKAFRQLSIPFIEQPAKDDWEWLFLMQHYGTPTRLLDWTESPLVGLYFAVMNTDDSEDAALWCLHPTELNAYSNIVPAVSRDLPFFGIDDELNNYLPFSVQSNTRLDLKPVAGLAQRNSQRMHAQAAVFTISHRKNYAVEEVDGGKYVWRYIIPKQKKAEIRKELTTLNINRLSLFPELENAALLVKEKYL